MKQWTLQDLHEAYIRAAFGYRSLPRRKYGEISKAAQKLGVTRQHLHLILAGERKSPRIERHPLFKSIKGAA